MAKYSIKTITNKLTWEQFVLEHKPQSFLQSWNWGESHHSMGYPIFRIGYYKGEQLVGVCQLIKQNAKRGPHLLIPGGPLIDWDDLSLVKLFVDSIKDLAKKEKAWFVRVRPELLDTPQNKELFTSLAFHSAPMHLNAENTWVLDITLPEEQLLQNMRKTTRYLVKKSLDHNLKFVVSTDLADTKILSKLQAETVARHNFVGFSEKLFKSQLETFGSDKQAALCICYKGKIPLAAAIIIFYAGGAYYHHSGSTLKYREVPASYFLQWNIIKEAKTRGCNQYNFWGVAPNDDPKHRFAGVTLFKKGFGGRQIDWLHAHDLPISSLYWATFVFENFRRKIRHL